MNKKSVSVLLLCSVMLLSYLAGIAHAMPKLYGYLGKNLRVEVTLGNWSGEMLVNKTMWVMIEVENYVELYMKNLQVEFLVHYGRQEVNFTVVKDRKLTLTAGWIGGFIKEMNFTPTSPGSLSIQISADYEYVDGNQTLEEKGTLMAWDLIYIPNNTPYWDLDTQNFVLQEQIANLNRSYESLNDSYQQQQGYAQFFAVTTVVFIIASIIAVAVGEKRYRRLRNSQPSPNEKTTHPL